MELKNFIGKVVICPSTKRRYVLSEITAPTIRVLTEKPNANGIRRQYYWTTINGDPITNGTLFFEDSSLTEPFKKAYETYSRSKNAYWEEYGYWMRKD